MMTKISAYTPQNRNNFTTKQPCIKRQNVSFGKKPIDPTPDKIDKFFIKIANTNFMKKLIDWSQKGKTKVNKDGESVFVKNAEKLSPFLMVAYSAFLQTNHVVNILRNDQMPKERKETLAVNNVLAFIIPTIGAFTIDGTINKGVDRFQKYTESLHGQKLNPKQMKGLKTIKSVFIFSMMYKYAATIITTPMADVVTDLMRDHGMLDKKKSEATKVASK